METNVLYQAAKAEMNKYENDYNLKMQQLAEATKRVETLSKEIEQVRGAYTSLYSLCKKYEEAAGIKPEVKPTEEEKQAIREKAHNLVEKAKKEGKITKYEDFAKSNLGKETAVEDIKDAVNVESLPQETKQQIEELKPKASETTKLTPEQIAKVSQTLNEAKPDEVKTVNKVKEEDIPDYLKEEYKK